jgi:hypothetical protein
MSQHLRLRVGGLILYAQTHGSDERVVVDTVVMSQGSGVMIGILRSDESVNRETAER